MGRAFSSVAMAYGTEHKCIWKASMGMVLITSLCDISFGPQPPDSLSRYKINKYIKIPSFLKYVPVGTNTPEWEVKAFFPQFSMPMNICLLKVHGEQKPGGQKHIWTEFNLKSWMVIHGNKFVVFAQLQGKKKKKAALNSSLIYFLIFLFLYMISLLPFSLVPLLKVYPLLWQWC